MLRDDQTLEEGEKIAHDLREKLGVGLDDLLSEAYMDMILKKWCEVHKSILWYYIFFYSILMLRDFFLYIYWRFLSENLCKCTNFWCFLFCLVFEFSINGVDFKCVGRILFWYTHYIYRMIMNTSFVKKRKMIFFLTLLWTSMTNSLWKLPLA